MGNQLVGETFKDRLRSSAKLGRDLQTCQNIFECRQLETITNEREAEQQVVEEKKEN